MINISCFLSDYSYIYKNLIQTKMKNKLRLIIVIVSVIAFVSCKDKASYSKIETTKEASKVAVHKIVVNDFIEAGTYVYLEVNEEGNEYWMAIPNTKIEKGATYYYAGGMQMKDFESEQLGRKFDLITFSEGIFSSEAAVVQPEIKDPHKAMEKKVVETEVITIDLPENGTSIGELYENGSSYAKKEVIVRGKVVKVNKNILDKNWIHIVDGTSFENKRDLTITSDELVNVGDTLTIKATVVLDKDFGGGYVYALLLENGKVVK